MLPSPSAVEFVRKEFGARLSDEVCVRVADVWAAAGALGIERRPECRGLHTLSPGASGAELEVKAGARAGGRAQRAGP